MPGTMTSEQRVYGALRRQPIDRVPTFEWLTSQLVRDALAPGCTYHEFIDKLDIDAAVVELDFKKEWLDATTYRDGWGTVKRKTAEEYALPLSGPLKDSSDLASYRPPDYRDPSHYKSLEFALDFHRGRRAVVLRLNDVFSIPSRLVSQFDEFLMALLLEPEYIKALIDMVIETYLGFAAGAVARGCKIIFTGDDYAANTGPLMSPDLFRDIFYPGLKRVMQGYKDLDLLVIKHSDGDIRPILDMIMDAPIDCIDPIDPLGGLELAFMKRTYGDRFCLKGNVECGGVLSLGTPEEVEAQTRKCLEIGMPGGGYICSSSNSILNSVKPENYKAMLDTIKRYGVY